MVRALVALNQEPVIAIHDNPEDVLVDPERWFRCVWEMQQVCGFIPHCWWTDEGVGKEGPGALKCQVDLI